MADQSTLLNEYKEQIRQLDDHIPLMMLPVKMQLRYMTIKHVSKAFISTVVADSADHAVGAQVQARLSTLNNALNGAANLPNGLFLPGVEVTALGGGLPEGALPLVPDKHELWVRVYPDDIFVQTHEEKLTEDERDVGFAYWNEIWKAMEGLDPGLTELCTRVENLKLGAWRVVEGSYGNSRAGYVIEKTKPTNHTGNAMELVAPPEFPVIELKDESWTETPKAEVLPDKFVIITQKGNTQKEYICEPVTNPLPLSFDPTTLEEDEEGNPVTDFDETETGRIIPEYFRWMTDFEEAVKVGMGFRIPLEEDEIDEGFDKIIALGIQTNSDKEANRRKVEQLFVNHHRKPGGMSFLPKGTPTNNTQKESSKKGADDIEPEESFKQQSTGFRLTTQHAEKTDGQRLAEALGLDDSVFQKVANADGMEARDAMRMNAVLWSATLGYFLPQLFTPDIDKATLNKVKEFFFNYVSGRGLLPSIRVDDQPYGILPTTAFSKWTLAEGHPDNRFLNNLINNLLNPLSSAWEEMVANLKHLNKDLPEDEVSPTLFNLLGLHAGSVDFFQRSSLGDRFIENAREQLPAAPDPTNRATQIDALIAQYNTWGIQTRVNTPAYYYVHSDRKSFLNGPLIDKGTLSETASIKSMVDDKNYLSWLGASDVNYNDVRTENFLGENPPFSPGPILIDSDISVAAPDMFAPKGEIVSIPVRIFNFTLMDAFSFDINFNPEVLQFQEANVVALVNLTTDSFDSSSASDGTISVSWELGPFELPVFDRTIFELKFKVIGDDRSESQVSFSDGVFSNDDTSLEFNLIPGTIKIGPLPPQAMLYLLARHALLRQYLDVGIGLGFENDVISEVLGIDFEESMVLVEQEGDTNTLRLNNKFLEAFSPFVAKKLENDLGREATELEIEEEIQSYLENEDLLNILIPNDRWRIFQLPYTPEGSTEETTVGEYLNSGVSSADTVTSSELIEQLKQTKTYLEELGKLPTAYLERLFTEHLDTCHYRLDAWLTGLVNQRLVELRESEQTGIFYGAYGYLENIKPAEIRGLSVAELVESELNELGSTPRGILPIFDFGNSQLSSAQINPILNESWIYLGDTGFTQLLDFNNLHGKVLANPREDSKNQGFIPTPSLGHAITAAVLRSGYLARRTTGAPEENLAINLNSSRVRIAMSLLQGLKNRQELGALLGYRFERAMHENDFQQHLLEFRLAFPFKSRDIDDPDNSAQEQIVARNVVNGLALIKVADWEQQIRDEIEPLARANAIIAEVGNFVNGQIAELKAAVDATKDLLTAESIYQMVLSQPERANAVLRTLNSGGGIQDLPEIVKVPGSGITVTHKVCIKFPLVGNPSFGGGSSTMRSSLSPHLNIWIGQKLPAFNWIKIRVRWQTGVDETGAPTYQYENFKLTELSIQPIDLVYMLHQQPHHENESEFRYRVNEYCREEYDLNEDQIVEILEADRTDFTSSFIDLFTLEPLVLSLAEIILNSRPLRPSDFLPAHDPDIGEASSRVWAQLLRNRVDILLDKMADENQDLGLRLSSLKNTMPWDEENLENNADTIKSRANRVRSSLLYYVSLGWTHALPSLERNYDATSLLTLTQLAENILEESVEKRGKARERFDNIETEAGNQEEMGAILLEIIESIMGKSFRAYPQYRIPKQADFETARTNATLLDHAGDFPREEWLQSLVPIRPRIKTFHEIHTMSELLARGEPKSTTRPVQLPLDPTGGDRWVGMEYGDYEPHQDTLSLFMEFPERYRSTGNQQCGLLVDEWTEIIPEKDTNAGIAMHYDQPNNEAPNAILLAVSPTLSGQWEWEDLVDTITETVELAKKRAVDPDAIKESPLGQLLPAILAAINAKGNTATLDFGRNMQKVDPGQFGLVIKDYDLHIRRLRGALDLSQLNVNLVNTDLFNVGLGS